MLTGVPQEAPGDLGASSLCELLGSTEKLRARLSTGLRVGTWLLERVRSPLHQGILLGPRLLRGPVSRAIVPSLSSVVGRSQTGAKRVSLARRHVHPQGQQAVVWDVVGTVAQLCPTLCNPMDCSPPGFSVHGILQASIPGWGHLPSSRGGTSRRSRTGLCPRPWSPQGSACARLRSAALPLTLPPNFRGPGYGGTSSQPSSGHWELGPAVLGAAGLLRAGQGRGQEALRAAAGPVGSAETRKPMAGGGRRGPLVRDTGPSGEVYVLPLQLAGPPARAGGAAGGDHGLLPTGRGPALLTQERPAPLRGSWARVGRKPCLCVSPPWDGVVSDPGSPALRGSRTDAPQGVGALSLGRLDGTHLLCLL